MISISRGCFEHTIAKRGMQGKVGRMRTYFLFLLNLKDMKVATTIFGKSPRGEAALKGKMGQFKICTQCQYYCKEFEKIL